LLAVREGARDFHKDALQQQFQSGGVASAFTITRRLLMYYCHRSPEEERLVVDKNSACLFREALLLALEQKLVLLQDISVYKLQQGAARSPW